MSVELDQSVYNKIDVLIQENVEIPMDGLRAAAYNKMSPKEQDKFMGDNYAHKKGLMGAAKALGSGALFGGLVGGGSFLANELADTNIDPVATGLLSAGLTGAVNAPGRYMEDKGNAKYYQDEIKQGKKKGALDKRANEYYRALDKGDMGEYAPGLAEYKRDMLK